jgi:hypothetical protein
MEKLILEIWDKLGAFIGYDEHGWEDLITKEDCAKEIDTLTKAHYFEFVEWTLINVVKNRFGIYALIESIDAFETLDEVYNYWLTEIKNK